MNTSLLLTVGLLFPWSMTPANFKFQHKERNDKWFRLSAKKKNKGTSIKTGIDS